MPRLGQSTWVLRIGLPVLGVFLITSPVAAAGWRAPVVVGTSSDGLAWMNSLAVTENGTAVAVFTDPSGQNGYQAAFLSRSVNGGATWSRASKLSDPSVCAAGSAAVSAVGSNVDVAWGEFPAADCTQPHTVGAVWYAHSSDNGKTFSAAKRLSPASGFAGVLDIASASSGLVVVGWTDDGSAAMYVRRSTDSGSNFEPAQLIGTTTAHPFETRPDRPDGSVTVAAGDGVAYVAYLSSQSTIKMRRSSDSGTTWSAPVKLAANADGFSEIDLSAEGPRAVVAYAATNGKTDWARYRETKDAGVTWRSAVNLTTKSQPHAWYTAVSIAGGTVRFAYTRCVTKACNKEAVYYRQRVGSAPLSSPSRVPQLDVMYAAYAAGVTAVNGKPIVLYFSYNGLGSFVTAVSKP